VLGAVYKFSLPIYIITEYIYVCVCVRACARTCVCVRAHAHVCVCVWVCLSVRLWQLHLIRDWRDRSWKFMIVGCAIPNTIRNGLWQRAQAMES
jgi:hypothetical protein